MSTALTEIAEQELFIVEELRAKEFNRLDLVALKAKTALDIEITDKLSYKIVHDAQIELRDNRTRISKGRLLFTEGLTKQTKDAIQCEKDLIARIQPTEEALKAKKEAYDKEQDRIKKEKEETERRILQERLEELQKYGVIQDIGIIGQMSDDGFRMMADQWKKKWEEKEALRIQEEAEVEKKRQIELDMIQKQKEENDRIAEENRKQAEENARNAQAIIDKENELKRQEELKTMQENARLKGIEDEKSRVESENYAKKLQEAELEKDKAFKKWLSDNGMTEDNRDDFKILYDSGVSTLWRKVSVFSN